MPKGNNSNTTDKLVIDIKVNVKKGATTQITNLTKSLMALNEVVKKTANIERYANALKAIGKELTKTTSNKGVSKTNGGANLLQTQDVEVAKQQTKELEQQVKEIKKINKSKKKGLDVDKKNNKESKKSSSFFGKFTRSIGRIALYRAIRAGLSAIVKSAKEGLQYFIQYDSATNKAMSNITNAGNQIKASLGVTLGNLLTSLEPLITRMSDMAVSLVDNLNMALAVMEGKDYYDKAIKNNKDYAESLKETNKQLLSFDKFESLNKTQDKQEYNRVGIGNEEQQKVSKFIGFMQNIKDIAVSIWEYWSNIWSFLEDTGVIDFWSNAISWIFNKIKIVYQWMADTSKWLAENWEEIVEWIKRAIKSVGDFFVNVWHTIANIFASIINGIANAFINLVNLWIAQINLLLKPIDRIAKLFGGNVQIGNWDANVNWKPYADGGMVDKGTRFIAGEAGAEVVHTSVRGTGVTNIEQFSQAMLQALATYGVARGSDVSFKGDVYIDRTKAGQLLEGSVYGEGVRVGHFKRV